MPTIEKFHKLRLAEIQLDRAIVVFLEHQEYPSAITLAGAAEEILGKYAIKAGGQASIETILNLIESEPETEGLDRKTLRDSYLNETKNALKHIGNGEEDHLERDWQTEAINLIIRASMNFRTLAGKLSPHIIAFMKHLQTIRPDLYENLDREKRDKLDSLLK